MLPAVTHTVSGIEAAPDVYREGVRRAAIDEGITARGEEVAEADAQVASWLDRVGLRRPSEPVPVA